MRRSVVMYDDEKERVGGGLFGRSVGEREKGSWGSEIRIGGGEGTGGLFCVVRHLVFGNQKTDTPRRRGEMRGGVNDDVRRTPRSPLRMLIVSHGG